jgi:serine phosphatase RsbU (regulator of sigma subunit)
MRKIEILFFVLIFSTSNFLPKLFSQNIDSLKLVVAKSSNKIEKVKSLGKLSETLPDGEWENYNEQLKLLCENELKNENLPDSIYNFFKDNFASSLNNLGYYNERISKINEAIDYYNQSLKIYIEISSLKGMASVYNNLGNLYQSQGNTPKALNLLLKCLKIYEKLGNKYDIALALNNIGYLYGQQNDEISALSYYKKSLKIKEEINDNNGIIITRNNIGYIYQDNGKFNLALECFKKNIEICIKTGDKESLAVSYNNIARVYQKQNDLTKAMSYYEQGLKLAEEIQHQHLINSSYNDIGVVYELQNNLPKAAEYYNKSLQVAKKNGRIKYIINSSENLFQLYKKQNNYKLALENYELFIRMKDSIFNTENTKKIVQNQMQYDFDKKQLSDSLKVAEERKLNEVKFKQEKTQRNFLYAGLVLVIVFLGFMYNRFKITKKQKQIIEKKEKFAKEQNIEIYKQKHLIEQKQKEIIDSITYAKRIQQAVLTGSDVWQKISKEHFILFKPKDIVSGDFYWAYNSPDNLSVFLLADCTGHGVPGAFMSMLGNSFLNDIVVENKIYKADEILNRLRSKIINALEQKGESGQRDGMDICLCVWNKTDNTLEYAGANNPLWVLKTTVNPNGIESKQLQEYKADKMPIGAYTEELKPFTSHTIKLFKGDTIYLITDGYADQFGGPKGKKFKYKALQEMFIQYHSLPMHEQKNYIDKEFENWKKGFDQIDDVSLIGVRV